MQTTLPQNPVFRIHPLLSLMLIVGGFVGCGPASPQRRLAGTWTGAPNVAAEVKQQITAAARDQPVPAAANAAAQFFGQLAANTILAVDLNLRSTGTVLVRGNCDAIGLPPDSDGTWRVVSHEQDRFQLELEFPNKTIAAKVILVKPDEMSMKFSTTIEPPASPAGKPADGDPATAPASAEPAKPKEISITFKRVRS